MTTSPSNQRRISSKLVLLVASGIALIAIVVTALIIFLTPDSPAKNADIFTKDVRVCYFNDSKENLTLTNFRYADSRPIGVIKPGNSVCTQGSRVITYMKYDDGYAFYTIAWNSEVLYPEVVFNRSNDTPMAEAYYSEGETVNSEVNGRSWSVTRLDDTDYKEFEYHFKG